MSSQFLPQAADSTSPPGKAAWRRPIPAWIGCLVVASAWLGARPYFGIRHDGILYMGQVINRLWPGLLANDMFFRHGSQDQFSLYSRLVAWLLSFLPLLPTEFCLLIAGQVALVWAIWQLIKNEISPLECWLGLVAVAVTSHWYGGLKVFAYGEEFLTARTFAEPLVLLALAHGMRRRWGLSMALGLLAMLLHPLIGLSGMALLYLQFARGRRLWPYVLACLIAFCALAFASVPPFSQFLVSYDPDWWAVVYRFNRQVALTGWDVQDYQVIAVDVTVLCMALAHLRTGLRHLIQAALLASAGLCLVSWVGGDLLRNQLVLSLQPWRVLWILHLLATLLIPFVGLGLLRRLPTLKWQTAGLLGLACICAQWENGWALLVIFVACCLAAHFGVKVGTRLRQVFLGVILMGLLIASLSVVVNSRRLLELQGGDSTLVAFQVVAMAPFAAFAFYSSILLAIEGRFGSQSALLRGMVVLVVALIACNAVQWDRRNPLLQRIEARIQSAHPFEQHIPAGAEVWWDEQLVGVWGMLHRPSYFHLAQGAGALFNRGTAMQFGQRAEAMEAFVIQKKACQLFYGLNGSTSSNGCAPTLDLLKHTCVTLHDLDYMVLHAPVYRIRPEAQWQDEAGSPVLYLYRCRALTGAE